jgi:hypothetical protein
MEVTAAEGSTGRPDALSLHRPGRAPIKAPKSHWRAQSQAPGPAPTLIPSAPRAMARQPAQCTLRASRRCAVLAAAGCRWLLLAASTPPPEARCSSGGPGAGFTRGSSQAARWAAQPTPPGPPALPHVMRGARMGRARSNSQLLAPPRTQLHHTAMFFPRPCTTPTQPLPAARGFDAPRPPSHMHAAGAVGCTPRTPRHVPLYPILMVLYSCKPPQQNRLRPSHDHYCASPTPAASAALHKCVPHSSDPATAE